MQQITSLERIKTATNKKDIIVMNLEDGNNIFDKETVKKLLKSEEDIKKGRTRKATDVIKELKSRYGF